MSSRTRNRIPTLLEPYIRLPPEASLILLTGTFNATPHWLVTRFLSAVLGDGNGGGVNRDPSSPIQGNVGVGNAGDVSEARGDGDRGKGPAVVLVSWMRDWESWRMEARRGGVCPSPSLYRSTMSSLKMRTCMLTNHTGIRSRTPRASG